MDLVDLIQQYWTIIVFVGMVIFSWSRYETKNISQDEKIKDVEIRLKETEAN